MSLAVLITAFFGTFGLVKVLQPFAYFVNLVDKPGGRKQHQGVIPLIGGLAVFAGVFLTAYLFINQPVFIRLFMVGGGFLVFLGALDDRYDLSPKLRLIGQILVAAIFVYGLDVYLASFGNLLGFGVIELGWLGYVLAICSLVGIVNAFNMLDGIDGLVGTLAVISFLSLAFLFAAAGQTALSLLAVTFVGAVSAFLVYNIWGTPSRDKKLNKIFMGDAGSMFIGLSLGVLLIYGSQAPIASFEPMVAVWFILLPMTDMFTLMYRRVKRGKSPLASDRTHIHHILMRAGFSSWQTLYILVFAQIALILMGITLSFNQVPEYFSFFAAILFVIVYQILMQRCWKFIRWNKRRFVAA